MTGFGRAEISLPADGRAVVEIRSVNHRFLEIECRLPEGLQGVEETVRSMAGKVFRRGQVRVSLVLKGTREPPPVVFQAELARKYVKQLRGLKRQLGLTGEITLEMILGLPQVVTVAERSNAPSLQLLGQIQKAISQALDEAVRMRQQEGRRLQKALLRLIGTTERLHGMICREVPRIQQGLQKRLADRIEAVLQNAGSAIPAMEPRSILAEAASFVQTTDVSEELDRMESHFVALRKAIGGRLEDHSRKGTQSSPGRTIDFLAQELHREVNTLGTKLRDGSTLHWVVDLKGQIEKLREQAANLE